MLGVTCHVQKSCTLLILVVKIEICFYYKWHWDTSKLDGDLSLDFSHRMSRYVLYFCRRKWLIRERNISPTVKFRPTPKISHRTEHGGGKSFSERKWLQKRKILKGDKEKDTNPNSIIMLSPILCLFFLCGNFLLIASPTEKFWPVLIPITFARQAELATSHEVRWLKGSR